MDEDSSCNDLIQYSDIEFVNGVFCRDLSVQKALYLHCRRYFFAHYSAIFFAPISDAEDIFEDAFITVWQAIEHRKIYVSDGTIVGKDGLPFKGNLTSYLMGVAKIKYLEVVRSGINWVSLDEINETENFCSYGGEPIVEDWIDEKNEMRDAISECISKLSERCGQILRLFYVEHKELDEILLLLPSFQSKDALKTAKNKCLNKLREKTKELIKIRRS